MASLTTHPVLTSALLPTSATTHFAHAAHAAPPIPPPARPAHAPSPCPSDLQFKASDGDDGSVCGERGGPRRLGGNASYCSQPLTSIDIGSELDYHGTRVIQGQRLIQSFHLFRSYKFAVWLCEPHRCSFVHPLIAFMASRCIHVVPKPPHARISVPVPKLYSTHFSFQHLSLPPGLP